MTLYMDFVCVCVMDRRKWVRVNAYIDKKKYQHDYFF